MANDPEEASAVGAVTQLMEAMAELNSTMERLSSLGTTFSAFDDSRCVESSVTSTGELQNLTIARDWNDYLEPEELGQAVVDSYGAAVAQYFQEFVSVIETPPGDGRTKPDATSVPPQAGPRLDFSHLSGESYGHVQDELLGTFDPIFDKIKDATTTGLEATPEKSVSKSGGAEVAVVSGGLLTSVSYEASWVLQASVAQIKSDTLTAFETAKRASAANHDELATKLAEVRDMTSATTDAKTLAQRLGVPIKE